MQRGILHTPLPAALPEASAWWAGGTEELVPSLTLLMYDVPKDSLRELTGPLSHLPPSLLTSGSCQFYKATPS